MALSPPEPLSWIRKEVFTRAKLNTGGDRGARALELVDSCIRRAQRELTLKAPWVRLKTTRYITLVDEVTEYDFPDDMDPGRIMQILVRDPSTKRRCDLKGDPSTQRQNNYANADAGQPRYFWFMDQALNITPKPDVDTWDRLEIIGFMAETKLVNDEDLCSVDAEALIQRANIFLRMERDLPVTPDLRDSHTAYLNDLRADQSEIGSVVIGGDTSWRCRPEDGADYRPEWYAYDSSWNPPGFPPLQ